MRRSVPSALAVAEYRALLGGLQRAFELGVDRIDARSDSKLLVAHLSGKRTPSNRKLVALGNEITDLIMRIGTVTVGWVPETRPARPTHSSPRRSPRPDRPARIAP